MRNFLMGMWGITTPIVYREAIQILTHEKGQNVAARLWAKFFLSWVLLFGPMLLINAVSVEGLRTVLGVLPVLFAVSPIFTGLDVFLFYALPGIRLDEEGIWVKSAGKMNSNFYRYRDVRQIYQLTIAEKKREMYQVEVAFADGSKWHTDKRPAEGSPFLVQLSEAIRDKCDCSISPVFDPGVMREGAFPGSGLKGEAA